MSYIKFILLIKILLILEFLDCPNTFQIESNNIFATINIKDGMVIFHDDPEKYNNPKVLEEIEQKVST